MINKQEMTGTLNETFLSSPCPEKQNYLFKNNNLDKTMYVW